MDRGDADEEFEDIIRGSWAGHPEDLARSSGQPTKGALQLPDGRWCGRGPDGTWHESQTGWPLAPALSARLEGLWQTWAPRLPDEVRRAVEDPGDS